MTRLLSEKTRQGIERIVNDPKFDIREDGTIWRQVGNVDQHGNFYLEYRIGDDTYRSLPVKYIIFCKFTGRLPAADKQIIHKDRNVSNNALNNLEEVTNAVYDKRLRRTIKNVSFDEILAVKKDYANGVPLAKMVSDYVITQSVLEDILGLPSTARRKRMRTAKKKEK